LNFMVTASARKMGCVETSYYTRVWGLRVCAGAGCKVKQIPRCASGRQFSGSARFAETEGHQNGGRRGFVEITAAE
jgi:hypothetical protein